jgi:hypothetical protein
MYDLLLKLYKFIVATIGKQRKKQLQSLMQKSSFEVMRS